MIANPAEASCFFQDSVKFSGLTADTKREIGLSNEQELVLIIRMPDEMSA